jgi:hypothetical protein
MPTQTKQSRPVQSPAEPKENALTTNLRTPPDDPRTHEMIIDAVTEMLSTRGNTGDVDHLV